MIYLIPSFLSPDAIDTIPNYVIDAVEKCQVIFAENERTARRFLKKMKPDIVIDHFEWFTIHKAEEEQLSEFKNQIKEGKNIAIISEAGCPGIADPGQKLVLEAQKQGATILPLVGPNSIILALMASGLNGQNFSFHGYLPIDDQLRMKKIKQLEEISKKDQATQIFIETPFRNNKMIDALLKHGHPQTLLCIASNLTASTESIRTRSIADWKKNGFPDLHKQPVIYLFQSV